MRYGDTALHIAANRGHESVARTMISQGIDVNIRGWGNRTTLMFAAWAGQRKVAKLLVRRGAGLNLQDGTGWTALMRAAYRGDTSIVISVPHGGTIGG